MYLQLDLEMLFPAYFPHKPKVISVAVCRPYLKIKLNKYLKQTFTMLAAKLKEEVKFQTQLTVRLVQVAFLWSLSETFLLPSKNTFKKCNELESV